MHWLQQLFDLWRDQWIGYMDIKILVVSPEPARAAHQTHVGHLLLVQGEIPQQAPVLVTMVFQSQLGHRLAHLATFLPEFFDIPFLLQVLRLERVCQSRGCFVLLDGQRVPDQGLGRVEAGDYVQLTAPPRQMAHSAFLQVDFHLSRTPAPPVTFHRQQDLEDIRLEYEYAHPVAAHALLPIPTPLLGGLEGALLTLWPNFGQPGPGGGEPMMLVKTWYTTIMTIGQFVMLPEMSHYFLRSLTGATSYDNLGSTVSTLAAN